ncbi:MAG: ABC transporter ATP-binding protein [Paludibacteraceae bacterium]|nr:ABC transporter ATP-binding protein [Paludibacteraceae bacterium]
MSNVSISTNKLSIGYADSGRKSKVESRKAVQRDLSFSLCEGEMVCMLGPNGCGKSTLLRTLAGLQPPLSGTYNLTGEAGLTAQRSNSDSVQTAQRSYSKSVSLVLTERLSLENTTVHDVVAMGRYPYTSFLGGLTEPDERIIAESLQQVGFSLTAQRSYSPQDSHTATRSVEAFASTMFNAHSDGEKQRILIAKALAQQTPIILLDEPTAHLDLPHRILILRMLRRLAHEQNKTILISTHELDLALALSDRILLMSPQGGGVLLDTPEALKKADAFTSAFGMDIFNPLG